VLQNTNETLARGTTARTMSTKVARNHSATSGDASSTAA
jgi:hypothetical protein